MVPFGGCNILRRIDRTLYRVPRKQERYRESKALRLFYQTVLTILQPATWMHGRRGRLRPHSCSGIERDLVQVDMRIPESRATETCSRVESARPGRRHCRSALLMDNICAHLSGLWLCGLEAHSHTCVDAVSVCARREIARCAGVIRHLPSQRRAHPAIGATLLPASFIRPRCVGAGHPCEDLGLLSVTLPHRICAHTINQVE